MLWVFVLVTALIYLYIKKVKPLLFWYERGVKQPPISHLITISLPGALRVKLGTRSPVDLKTELYNLNPNKRYVGRYDMGKNLLVIKDIDLIKTVTVKGFENFTDHITFSPPGFDLIWDKNLFALRGQPWRDMRSTLSPTFTGSKMRNVFAVIEKVSQQMIDYHLNQKKDFFTISLKDFFTRFTNDIIATTAFGVEVNSFENPENNFYLSGVETTAVANPFKRKTGGPRRKTFPDHIVEFFRSIVQQTIEFREKNNIERPDVLQLLINTKKNSLQEDESVNTAEDGFSLHQEKNLKAKKLEITDDDIIAQALIFFFAGFDAVASGMCYAAYELALNPEVQQKLHNEIIETWRECKGNLSYEVITKMTYMDCVVSEVLRKWPSTENLNRQCTKTFTIDPVKPDEKPLIVPAGTAIEIPVFQIHRDPQFYPEPDRFIPERFTKENRHNIIAASYMPFGAGPRICIGNRLALLEIKVIFFHILQHFEIVPVADTPRTIQLHPLAFNLNMVYHCPLGLKLRN